MSRGVWRRGKHPVFSRETRVGACADYLLGKKTDYIREKWGVSAAIVAKWVKEAGFQLRGRGSRTTFGPFPVREGLPSAKSESPMDRKEGLL